MAKKTILVEHVGGGRMRKRAYCSNCKKRVTIYQKVCHHCGEKFVK